MNRPSWDREQLASRAAYVLRSNSAGAMTRAAPDLYPHQWSWDAAFVAVGLAHVDVPRACQELDALFAGQWSTGMLPHIVFNPSEDGYFPGPDRWACAERAGAAPRSPRTSGICQPPVHALAVERIGEVARNRGGAAEEAFTHWLPGAYDRLLRWHRYLAHHRDPDRTGLLTIYHGWESGMDNSPRWDLPYAAVEVGRNLPPYHRRDTAVVQDPTQRPSTPEYDRYLWLIEELKRAGYDDDEIRPAVSFRTTDVVMSAVFAAANDALAEVARCLGRSEEAELTGYAQRFREGVAAAVDPVSGLAVDTDLITGRSLPSATIGGFAPLLCGGLDAAAEQAMIELLGSARWAGHPSLLHPVLPSTSPESAAFDPRAYWRGPSWPVLNWFFAWSLARRGVDAPAAWLSDAAVQQLRDGSLAEYYEPLTGEPLGSLDQSWSAAAALDLLLHPQWGH